MSEVRRPGHEEMSEDESSESLVLHEHVDLDSPENDTDKIILPLDSDDEVFNQDGLETEDGAEVKEDE
ncbi:MAG: hypothetical protein HYT15_01780 [Candidatus Magasanikbacteria bacterium]|nr:hypothetical protein [Candidatus Magasanikbacteria bacterium]